MNVSTDQAALGEKLMAPVSNILNQHRASIAPLLGGGGTAALQNDENVRKVATFCYPGWCASPSRSPPSSAL
jgi:hypothetical protein